MWNKLYRADIIKKNRIFFVDNSQIFAEDICFNLYYISFCKRIEMIQECLYNYLNRENSIMGKSKKEPRLNQFIMISKCYEEFLEELQTSLSIRRSREFLDEVEREELTFDEFQVNISKLGNEYNLGTSSKWSADQIMYELQRHEEKIRFNRSLFYSEVVQPSKKTVNVIGARTGVGKSAFALNVLNDLADKYMCLYFNLEMTEKEIYQRLMAIQSGIPINRFGKLTDKEKGFLSDAAYRFERDMKIKLYNGSKSMEGIVKIVARESRREHCIVFIDHIGYITNRKISNTRERIQNTMIELNTMSKDYDCTVFALSQLNRDTEGTPKLVNLKDSGEVEQTAHSIVLLNDLTKDFNASVSDYELICAKNRGMTGRRKVYFNKYNQRFYEK